MPASHFRHAQPTRQRRVTPPGVARGGRVVAETRRVVGDAVQPAAAAVWLRRTVR